MKPPQVQFSVLIPDGDSEFALFAAHCLATHPGVRVHVLSDRHWAPVRFSRHCRSYKFARTLEDDNKRVRLIEEIVKKNRIDVLLPTSTDFIAFVVSNRAALERFVAVADVPTLEAFRIANNKWLLSEFLKARDIPGPPTLLISDRASLDDELRQMEFPVLLKPVSAWGGDGIERFDNVEPLLSHLERIGRSLLHERFIVQTLLPGSVVGINLLARQGKVLAMTVQKGIIPNTHKFAAAGAIQFIEQDPFAEIAHRLARALDWNGFANVDTLRDSRDGKLKILEINARFWGSLRGSLLAGVSFPYLACLAALNIPFDVPDYQMARYFHTTTALREAVSSLRGQGRVQRFGWQETGVKFLLSDPLAEGLRALQQQFGQEAVATI